MTIPSSGGRKPPLLTQRVCPLADLVLSSVIEVNYNSVMG